jgi:hypothetical protein
MCYGFTQHYPSGSKPFKTTILSDRKRFSVPAETLAPGLLYGRLESKRFDCTVDVSAHKDFELGIFRYGIRLRFTIMIESRSAHFVVNRGPIHNGEIEDVAFNGAL